MSNVKDVRIEFVIDFDFGGSAVWNAPRDKRAELLRRIEALQNNLFCMCTMPCVGLSLSWAEERPRDNAETGGLCSRSRGVITGREAFSFGAFETLRSQLAAIPHTEIAVWEVRDIEA